MLTAPPVLATTWRGEVREALIRGHVAVVAADGEVLASLGDPDVLVTLRSCVKPLQALPFVALAVDALGVPPGELAVACASHHGDARHVAAVESLLQRAGAEEATLECGPQLPIDRDAARAVIAAGAQPRRIHNNCSGKHAAMLATCSAAGWPQAGYSRPDHPCQLEVTSALERLLGCPLQDAPQGIDGCGLPTYGVPLSALARSFAVGQAAPGFERCQEAMVAHPHLVAGRGAFDTALLEAAGARVTPKSGGAAIWAAALRESGRGVAIKLEAGAADGMPVVATAALQRLQVLPPALPDSLAGFASLRLLNWSGLAVGATTIEWQAFEAL